MFCLRSALFSLGLLFGLFGSTSEAATVRILNLSRSNVVTVATVAGPGVAEAQSEREWVVDTSSVNTNYVDGVSVGTWQAGTGHEYVVTVDAVGVCTVFDLSGVQTSMFWLGFTFVFAAGLLALGARWVRIIIGGTTSEAGD